MKTMTCRELGGVCDEKFSAKSFEEMVELSKAHGMEMFAKGDEKHMEIMSKIMEIMNDPKKQEEWIAQKRNIFENLPEN